MKFLNYISTLLVPSKMGQRKNMNVFISLLIMIIASYVISLPYIKTFEDRAYETYCNTESFNFRVMDSQCSVETEWTEEEKVKYGSDYVLTTVDELNDVDFVVKGKKFVLPDGVSDLKDVSFNKKEYLLKRTVYYFDNEGTKLDKTDIFYIHIVFDLYDDIADHYYVVNDKFDKKLGEENHYLFVFYTEGFCYRNEYMVDNDLISYAFEYKEQDIDFKEMQELDYVTKKVTDLLIPESKTQYSFNGFVYTVIVPLIAAAFGLLLARRKVVLQKYKHYYNMTALATIPVAIIFFAISWIPSMISFGIMELYWVAFAIYYCIVISIVNRKTNIN